MDPEPSTQILAILLSNFTFWTGVKFAILLILLLFSGIVSGSEVAFFGLDNETLSQLQDSTKKKDVWIIKLLDHPKRLLATILIFNNFVNVAIVTLSTVITWEMFGRDDGSLLLTIVSIIVTFFIVFFGEIIPKVFANRQSLSFANKTVFLIHFADIIFRPFAVVLNKFTGIVEKRIKTKGYEVSVEELNQVVEMTTNDSTDEEKEILKGIVNFGTTLVKQVMQSRLDITAVDVSNDFHEVMDKINKCGFSRIPVYQDRIDNIQGILYVKDILPFINQDEHFSWQKLLRKGYFIPETKKIGDLLKDFQEMRVHMAIVVDEYGGTSGLITLEDIIEEIVGDINDEFDVDSINYVKKDENIYVFEGKTSLNDLIKVLDVGPTEFDEFKGESESIGGLLLEINSSIPNVGEKISVDKYDFIIEAVNKKRIKRVRVEVKELKNDEK